MKRICLILLVLPILTFGQEKSKKMPFPTKNGDIFYEEVGTVDSTMTASILYTKALTWFISNINDDFTDKIFEDREHGKVIGYRTFDMRKEAISQAARRYSAMIDITVKDGKYRAQIYDIKFKETDSTGYSEYGYVSLDDYYRQWQKQPKFLLFFMDTNFLTDIDEQLNACLRSIKKEMERPYTWDDF